MSRLIASSALPATMTLAALGAWAGGRQEKGFELVELTESVTCIVLTGGGGNLGAIEGNGELLVIDSNLARAKEAVLEGIEAASELPVRWLVNTHWHGDHTGNNAAVAGDGTILAHVNVRRRVSGDPGIAGRTSTLAAGNWPDVTYEEGASLYLGSEEVRLVHVPTAHTDGDTLVVLEGQKVVHMGDVFFNGRFPFIDVTSGGDVSGLIAAVERALELCDETWQIIPGHGPVARRADLEAYHAMLVECAGRVKAARAEGKGALEMRDAGLLDDYAAEWGGGFVDAGRFIDSIFASFEDD